MKLSTTNNKPALQHPRLLAGILIGAFICMLYSCSQSTAPDSSSPKSYFDLEGTVQKDIDENSAADCGELKTVYVNGLKETKSLDSIDWKKELQPIIECDINKPAWKGKFAIDTVPGNKEGSYSVRYKPLSEKINIKNMQVHYEDGRISNIFITKQIRSFIFSSSQAIRYFPGKGFEVRGEQQAAMMENFELNVDVKYSCN